MDKQLNTKELYDLIIAKREPICVIMNESNGSIPSGTMLYFGIYEHYITSHEEETKGLNEKFKYEFNYHIDINSGITKYSFTLIENIDKYILIKEYKKSIF